MLLFHIVGTVMYVGTILSHIAIPKILGNELIAIYYASLYKEATAYYLILPGITLKTISGIIMAVGYQKIPLWLKIKVGCAAFLLVNAFVFLVPMMTELKLLAQSSLEAGMLSDAYIAKEHTEMLVGISNVLPLVGAIILGVFKPTFKRG